VAACEFCGKGVGFFPSWRGERLCDRCRPTLKVVVEELLRRAHDGALPPIATELRLKPGEAAYMMTPATLVKDVLQQQWQSDSEALSFSLGHGMRFTAGSSRGHTAILGRALQAIDQGMLTVTSARVVYVGDRHTIELKQSKIISLDVFDDAVRLHVSNRQHPTLVQLLPGFGWAVAATVDAAFDTPAPELTSRVQETDGWPAALPAPSNLPLDEDVLPLDEEVLPPVWPARLPLDEDVLPPVWPARLPLAMEAAAQASAGQHQTTSPLPRARGGVQIRRMIDEPMPTPSALHRNDIDRELVRKVVKGLPQPFATKDVSGHPRILRVYRAFADGRQYHAVFGSFLSANQQTLGLRRIGSGGARGVLWERV
jgi:hypothetical protein